MASFEDQAFDFFVRALDDPHCASKRIACEGLAKLQDPRAIEPLLRRFAFDESLLHREDAEAAVDALLALGPGCIPRLVRALGDEDPNVRQYAAHTLGRFGNRSVIGPLVDLLGDGYQWVREAAVEALAALGEKELASAFRGALAGSDAGRAALKALVTAGDLRAIGPLARVVGDEKDGEAASDALVSLGEVSVPAMLSRLSEPAYFFTRCAQCQTLGRLGDARAIAPLKEFLKDEDSRVCSVASWALFAINTDLLCQHMRRPEELVPDFPAPDPSLAASDPAVDSILTEVRAQRYLDSRELGRYVERLAALGQKAVGPLCVALSDAHSEVRRCAALALGQIGDPHAVSDLSRGLGESCSGRSDLHWAAELATALGNIGHRSAIPALSAALAQSLPRWQCPAGPAAAEALGKIADPAALPILCDALRVQWLNTRLAAVKALGGIGEAAVPILCAALEHGCDDVRLGSAGQLGEIGDPSGVPSLRRALTDCEDRVRQNACWALGRLRAADAVPDLCDALNDRRQNVRRYAAAALGQIGDPRAVGPLSAALETANGEDDYDPVGPCAAASLGEIGDPDAIPVLRKALQQKLRETRQEAVEALARLGDLQGLCQALEVDKGDRAAEVLTAAGDPAIDLIRKTIRGRDTGSRRAVAVLGKIGSRQAAQALVALLPEEDLWSDVANALRAAGSTAIEPVCDALDDDALPVRMKAATLLIHACEEAPSVELRQALPVLTRRRRFWSREPRWAKQRYHEVEQAILAVAPAPAGKA